MNKKIYFHADDFGRSKVISQNIYKCIKLKIINSISVMVGFNEYYFDHIKKDRLINIKLHLNLIGKVNINLTTLTLHRLFRIRWLSLVGSMMIMQTRLFQVLLSLNMTRKTLEFILIF